MQTPAPHYGAEADLDDWLEAQAQQDADFDEIYAPPADTAQADRLLGVLRWLERQEADTKAVAEARHQEITDWWMSQQHSIEQRRAHIERLLEGWTRAQYEASGRRDKTWNLPNGALTLRAGRPRLEVMDTGGRTVDQVLHRFGPAAVKIERTVVKSVVKDCITTGAVAPRLAALAPSRYTAYTVADKTNGEIVPGLVLLVPDQDAFTAKPKPRAAS